MYSCIRKVATTLRLKMFRAQNRMLAHADDVSDEGDFDAFILRHATRGALKPQPGAAESS